MESILFIGVQGCGKTSFYLKYFFKTHVHISLDLLKTRNRERIFMLTCLTTGQCYVVDNTNPKKEDRANYIAMAKEFNFKVIGYYFESSLFECLDRNAQRQGKEQIPAAGIKSTYSEMEIPVKEEGFDKLYKVKIEYDDFIISEL